MGSLTVYRVCFVPVLCAASCFALPVSDSLVVVTRPHVSVHRGSTTTLPCWLSQPQSAEGLEVRWYHPNYFDHPVMYYREKKFVETSQEASYVGRVSFGLKDAESVGLLKGDVSLKLVNVTLEDVGIYTCYVSSDQGYDRSIVNLTVTETGTPLLLSAEWKEDNMVKVSCESGGWYPKPSLRWSDQTQVLTPKSLTYRKDSSGLMSVHSWLLVSASTEVFCSVGLSGEEARGASMRLDNPPQPGKQVSPGSPMSGWVAFIVLLIFTLAALGALLYLKKRGRKAKSGSDHAEENQKLLSREKPTDLSTAKKHHVNVTLVKKEHPYLVIKDCMLRDVAKEIPDGKKVTCLTAIRGTPGFSSGQHYWEVSMGNNKVGIKQSWWVGVTSACDIPLESVFPLSPSTASNGFWFLSSSPDRADSFQISTEPEVLLPVSSRPQTVGVYLDYDSGELSFYDVEHEKLIVSLAAKFTGEVFPLFNPGKDDKAPMTILQVTTEEGQSSQAEEFVDSTALKTAS